MKKVMVSLPAGIFQLVHGLKGKLGESDSEVIRTMVISFLGEKGYLLKEVEQ
jgi:metal-responsive CopG/Arc/MetJ family transcriptional regulator